MPQKERLHHFDTNQVIFERWKVVEKLGEGAFGAVYKVFDQQTQQSCAMKTEDASKVEYPVLKLEVYILERLQGLKHACRLIGQGKEGNINFVVMSMIGRSLADLRSIAKDRKFSISTTTRVIKQCIEAVEDLHNIGYLHRDIKPGNFAVGRHDMHKRTIFMLDYGMCRRWTSIDASTHSQVIRSPRTDCGFQGTVRYASCRVHKRLEYCRNDDLWSLFYMAVEFIRGELPWSFLELKEDGVYDCEPDVGTQKAEIHLYKLLKGCPAEFLEWHHMLYSCDYTDKPEYSKMQILLDEVLRNQNAKATDAFDWELNESTSRLSFIMKRTSSSLKQKTPRK